MGSRLIDCGAVVGLRFIQSFDSTSLAPPALHTH